MGIFQLQNRGEIRLNRKTAKGCWNWQKPSQEQIQQMIQLYGEGDGGVVISQKLGVKESSVYWHLRKNGVEMRSGTESLKEAYKRGNHPYWMAGRKGELCPNYKGGYKKSNGYKMILEPNYYRSNKGGYVLEHIYIWEKVHNKHLPRGWCIHHLNGITDDNRPANLLAMPRKTHDKFIPELKKRIRQLEAEVKLLEKALDNSQMLFTLEEN